MEDGPSSKDVFVPDHPHMPQHCTCCFQSSSVVVDSVCTDVTRHARWIIHVRTAHHRCQAQSVAQDTEQMHGKHFSFFFFFSNFSFFRFTTFFFIFPFFLLLSKPFIQFFLLFFFLFSVVRTEGKTKTSHREVPIPKNDDFLFVKI